MNKWFIQHLTHAHDPVVKFQQNNIWQEATRETNTLSSKGKSFFKIEWTTKKEVGVSNILNFVSQAGMMTTVALYTYCYLNIKLITDSSSLGNNCNDLENIQGSHSLLFPKSKYIAVHFIFCKIPVQNAVHFFQDVENSKSQYILHENIQNNPNPITLSRTFVITVHAVHPSTSDHPDVVL